MDKRTKMLCAALAVLAPGWYFTRSAPVDETAVMAAVKASAEKMKQESGVPGGAVVAAPLGDNKSDGSPARLPNAVAAPHDIAPPTTATASTTATSPAPTAPAAPESAAAAAPGPAPTTNVAAMAEASATLVTSAPPADEIPGPTAPASVTSPAPESIAPATPAPRAQMRKRRVKSRWALVPLEDREGKHDLIHPVNDRDWKDVTRDLASVEAVAADGETVVDVARRIYGDSNLWPKLWSLNPQIGNPYDVPAGTHLRVK